MSKNFLEAFLLVISRDAKLLKDIQQLVRGSFGTIHEFKSDKEALEMISKNSYLYIILDYKTLGEKLDRTSLYSRIKRFEKFLKH